MGGRSGKLKANSLFITIVIALVLGIICSLLILLSYNTTQIDRMAGRENKLQRNLRSATQWVLADTSLVLEPREDRLDLLNEQNDTIAIRKENWGVFGVASIRVAAANKNKLSTFFFGQTIDSPLDGCLYLAEHKTPLSLGGYASLNGDAYLPKGGPRPAFIDQHVYAFTEFVKGIVKESEDSLPPVDSRLMNRLLERKDSIEQSLIPDTLERSFADTVFNIHRKGLIDLSSCQLEGYIYIRSDSFIRVEANADLHNVLLSAPAIVFEPGFTGSVQAIASDSIIVGNDCRLLFPSVLVLSKTSPMQTQPQIRVGDTCSIDGMIMTYLPFGDSLMRTYVEVGKTSTITGVVYVSGFLFLKGKVVGTVLAENLLFKSRTSIAVNVLMDASIDRKSLSQYFVMPRVLTDHHKNKIVQWVN